MNFKNFASILFILFESYYFSSVLIHTASGRFGNLFSDPLRHNLFQAHNVAKTQHSAPVPT